MYGNKKAAILGLNPKMAAFYIVSEHNLYGETAAEKEGVRPILTWWSRRQTCFGYEVHQRICSEFSEKEGNPIL